MGRNCPSFTYLTNHLFTLLRAKREPERSTLILRGFCPDFSAVALHDSLHDGEANAAAGKLLPRVQTLEHPEKLVRMLHGEARAVVLHEVSAFTIFLGKAHFDARRFLSAREFEGIRKKIYKHLAQLRGVTVAIRQIADLDFHMGCVLLFLQR